MLAPGIMAPVGSCTRPARLPVGLWADSAAAQSRSGVARQDDIRPPRLRPVYSLSESLAQYSQTLRNRGGCGFAALHFKRNVSAVTGPAQDAGDALVIQFQRVPLAAAVVRLGLHDGRVRRQLFDAGVGVAGEIPGIQVDAQPRRIHSAPDAQ